jgi:hypothetical protein
LLVCAAGVAVAAGCGAQREEPEPETSLTISIRGFDTVTYRLRCTPPGGDAPDPTRTCALLRAHRLLMAFPPRMTSTCIGGVGIPPEVLISGVVEGRQVAVDYRACDWPAGAGAAVWVGLLTEPRTERLALAQLRCTERAAPFARSMPAAVRACYARAARRYGGS